MNSEHLGDEIEAAIDQLVQATIKKADANGVPVGMVMERFAKRFVQDQEAIDELWRQAIGELLSLGMERAAGRPALKRPAQASKPPADALSPAAIKKLVRKITKLLEDIYIGEALPIWSSVFVGLMELAPIEDREEYWVLTLALLNTAREDQRKETQLN
jgi:hypothetical protein